MLITPFRGFEDLDLKASGQASRGAVGRETQIHIQYKMKKRGHLYRGQGKKYSGWAPLPGAVCLVSGKYKISGSKHTHTHWIKWSSQVFPYMYIYINIYDYCKYI